MDVSQFLCAPTFTSKGTNTVHYLYLMVIFVKKKNFQKMPYGSP